MVSRNSKAVSSSPENIPSAAPFWPMGMVLLVCAALFAGCAAGAPNVLEESLANIESSDEADRLKGIETLSSLGEEVIKPHATKIAALLKDTSAEVRRTAITVLISLEHNSPEFVQELSAMVSGDAEATVQTTALHALLDIGANEQFMKGCKEAIAGGDAAKKGEAIMYLGEAAGGGVAGAKEELEAIASGSDAEAATAAKDSLKMLEEQ